MSNKHKWDRHKEVRYFSHYVTCKWTKIRSNFFKSKLYFCKKHMINKNEQRLKIMHGQRNTREIQTIGKYM